MELRARAFKSEISGKTAYNFSTPPLEDAKQLVVTEFEGKQYETYIDLRRLYNAIEVENERM